MTHTTEKDPHDSLHDATKSRVILHLLSTKKESTQVICEHSCKANHSILTQNKRSNKLGRTMKLHYLFLSMLALPSSTAPLPTLRGFPGFVENKRYLQDSSPACDNPETLYYNMYFTLYDLSPFQNATAQCSEGDYTEIGFLIQDIVKAIDQSFPKHVNEFIRSFVCPVPAWSLGEAQNRRRALLEDFVGSTRRRLGTYTYTSGGRCRRCTYRRLQLAPTVPATEGSITATASSTAVTTTAKEAVAAACDMEATCKAAFDMCEVAFQRCQYLLDDIAGLEKQ